MKGLFRGVSIGLLFRVLQLNKPFIFIALGVQVIKISGENTRRATEPTSNYDNGVP
jgi:hypothetical protein